jgi:hypothetical protein
VGPRAGLNTEAREESSFSVGNRTPFVQQLLIGVNRYNVLYRKWFVFNEQVAYKRIINCTNVEKFGNMGKYFYKIRSK